MRNPTEAEIRGYLDRDRWRRWGEDDQLGALNLITSEKRIEAARLVKSGVAISLSQEIPQPADEQGDAVQRFLEAGEYGAAELALDRRLKLEDFGQGRGGASIDYLGIAYHHPTCTHIDALCHVWDEGGMWGGRQPDEAIEADTVSWGGIEQWRDGILTRGILIDIPAYRGVPHVTQDRPVHGDELAAAAAAQGVTIGPGDALVVYSGRDEWERHNPRWGSDPHRRPGLHMSCLRFLRDVDCSVLVWDMTDYRPSGYNLPFAVHSAIFALGIALVDAAALRPLVDTCRADSRYEFMLTVNPLVVAGGTGSPVNPIAVL